MKSKKKEKKKIFFTYTYHILFCAALTIAFGSLYHDDVSIKPSHVVPVLAAATLLSLVSIKFNVQ